MPAQLGILGKFAVLPAVKDVSRIPDIALAVERKLAKDRLQPGAAPQPSGDLPVVGGTACRRYRLPMGLDCGIGVERRALGIVAGCLEPLHDVSRRVELLRIGRESHDSTLACSACDAPEVVAGKGVAGDHERFLLIDVHSYNHRRDGADGQPTPQEAAPDINIGTFSMPRDKWAWLVDPLIEAMREFDFNGRRLDVRENVAFQGKGEQTRFVHQRYAGKGCAIALEFKKFYMDEWTGEPDARELEAMRQFIGFVAQTSRELLG